MWRILARGVRAADVSSVGDTGQCQVVDEMTPRVIQPAVLRAFERLPDPFLLCVISPSRCAQRRVPRNTILT